MFNECAVADYFVYNGVQSDEYQETGTVMYNICIRMNSTLFVIYKNMVRNVLLILLHVLFIQYNE